MLSTVRKIQILRDPPITTITPQPQPVAVGVFPLPPQLPPAPNPIVSGSPITLVAGSIWIFAFQLDPKSPAGSYCGFRIKSGTMTLQGQSRQDATGAVHIHTNDILTVTAVVDAPAAPPPVTGPGADATAAVVNLPATVTIEFRHDGAHITQLSAFGVTAYGSAVSLSQSTEGALYDAASLRVLIPAVSGVPLFSVKSVQSTLFVPSGSAPVTKGAWALAITSVAVPQLDDAGGAGAVALQLGPGISARWTGMAPAQKFSTGLLLAEAGRLIVILGYAGPRVAQTLQLWQEASSTRRCSVQIAYPAGASLRFGAGANRETVELTGAAIAAHLDRPLKAAGTRLPLDNLAGAFVLNQDAAGIQVGIQTAPVQPSQERIAFALRNALLITGAVKTLALTGHLQNDNVTDGLLSLSFALQSLLPTLPDPYITPYSTQLQLPGNLSLQAVTTWSAPASAQLSFESLAFAPGIPQIGGFPGLLDVSSNVDQLGVFFGTKGDFPIRVTIKGLDATGPAGTVSLLTLPEISWEPVYSDGSDGLLAGAITSDNDGGPSGLTLTNSVKLVPIAPAPVAAQILADAAAGQQVDADVTLPFGLFAVIRDPQTTYTAIQPAFPGGFKGGVQLRLTPPERLGLIDNPADPGFLGFASTRSLPYGAAILGSTAANTFNGQFGQSVPLLLYDFSGYGASFFSDWRKSKPVGTQIIKAQFNVLVGRTSVEVVQLQSFIYPWGIRVVRTITLDRKNSGGVLRHDSGWQPAGDGRLQLPAPGFVPHPGPLAVVTSIHNIREAGQPFTLDNARHWETVIFDADFVLNAGLVVTGGTGGADRLPSRDITGYLVADVGKDATTTDVDLLLANRAAAGDVSGTVAVQSTGVQLRASQVTVSSFPSGGSDILVVSLRGSPVLPATGSWTVAKRQAVVGAPPLALDPRTPLPLIRRNGDPVWYLSDPVDILNPDTPLNEYGLLQATGTQKVFFPRPRMAPPATQPPPGTPAPGFHLPGPPSLADVGALFNAAGLFPDLRSALTFDGAATDLKSSPDGLEIHGTIDTTAFKARPLVDFGPVKVLIDYHDEKGAAAKAKVDITPAGWSIDLGRINFPLITPLGADPLLKVVGNATASSTSAPTLKNLDIVFGGALAPIENIFANLQQLAKFLPGGGDSFLDVGFSNGRLTVRDVFSLPRLPLGAGFLKDISLDIGMTMQLLPPSLEFTVGIGSTAKPFQWLVFPLSGTGVIQIGVANGDLAILIQAGIGAGIAIDVGIAVGSASVVIALQVSITGSDLKLMVLLTATASVDVLDGLASATISLTAGLGVTPEPFPPDFGNLTHPIRDIVFQAAVGVSIHLSVCWLVHVDFDGYWQFSQKVDVPDALSILPI